jgi:hypothetical protein
LIVSLELHSKKFLLLRNWIHILPTLFKLSSQKCFINRLNLRQNFAFIFFLIFMQLYRVKCIKCMRTRKYGLEHKCEWNLLLLRLFLAIVTHYLNFIDTVLLAHPFWILATFPYSSRRSKLNLLIFQAILNWELAVESWVTIPAMGATIMWLQIWAH